MNNVRVKYSTVKNMDKILSKDALFFIKRVLSVNYLFAVLFSIVMMQAVASGQGTFNIVPQPVPKRGSELHGSTAVPPSRINAKKSAQLHAAEITNTLKVSLNPSKSIYAIGDTVKITWEGTDPIDRVSIDLWKDGQFVKNINENVSGTEYTYVWEKGYQGNNISFVVTINPTVHTVPSLHSGKINSIDWSNDDAEILTTGGARRYYLNTKKFEVNYFWELGYDSTIIINGNKDTINVSVNCTEAQFHPLDKKYSLVASEKHRWNWLQIWSTNGQIKRSYTTPLIGKFIKVDFNNTGSYILSTIGNDTLYLSKWSLDNDTTSVFLTRKWYVGASNGDIINEGKFSPDGSKFVVLINDYLYTQANGSYFVNRWSLYNFSDSGTIEIHKHKENNINIPLTSGRNISALAWSPQSDYFVTQFGDIPIITIGIWSVNDGQLKFQGNEWVSFSQVDWSKDGKYIASVGEDGYLVLWNNKGELLKKHLIPFPLTTVKFSNDSRKIAIGDANGNLYIINNIPLFTDGTSHPAMTASSDAIEVAMPQWNAQSTSVDFGLIDMDETNEKTISIRNTGKVPLTITEITSLPTGFSWKQEPNFPLILQTGATKNYQIIFSPTVETTYNGEVTVRAQIASPETITFQLSGTGVAPAPVISGNNSVSFPETACKKVQVSSIKIRNDGKKTLEVSDIQINGPFAYEGSKEFQIRPKESKDLTIEYDPNLGSQSGVLTVKSNAKNGDFSIQLKPTKQEVKYYFTQKTIDLGEVCLGSDSTLNVTLTQNGTFSPTITMSGDINGNVNSQQLSSNSITFSLPLLFDKAGSFTKTISAKNDECESYSENITITGYAGTPKLLRIDTLPDTLRTDLEEEIKQIITIRNDGDITAQLSMDVTQFSPLIVNTKPPERLAKGESTDIVVSYTAKEKGENIAATLLFSDQCNGKNTPLEIPLRGESYRDDPDISSDNINFGEQLIGYESAPRKLIIRNKSDEKATFLATVKESSSAFTLSYVPKLIINARDSIVIPVVFKPEAKGKFSTGIDLRRVGRPTKTNIRVSGDGIERDPTRDKFISLILENRMAKGKTITAKDIIDIDLQAFNREIDTALKAFNTTTFPYTVDLQWNPRLLALTNSDEEMTVSQDGGRVTIKSNIASDPERGAYKILKKLRFEVLWGEVIRKDSIAFGFINIDTVAINQSSQARLWTPSSGAVILEYDPTCVSGFVRGAIYNDNTPEIRIHPNPTAGIMTTYISAVDPKEYCVLEVFSQYGSKILSTSFMGNAIDIDVSDYSSGQYTVTAKTQRGIARTMVIIMK